MADDDVKDVEQLLTETPAEPAKEQEQPKEAPKAEPKADEQPRDEAGKFAAKEKPAEAKAEPKPETVKAEPDDKDGQVPSWRLREIAEERRQARAEADAAKAELAETRRRLAVLEKPAVEQKQERPDPLLDPEGYDKWIEARLDKRLSENNLNTSMRIAHVVHKDKFEKAYQALFQQGQSGNSRLVTEIVSASDPGEALVRWFNDQEVLREVGSDPASYKNKVLDEALKNPEFLAKAIEAAKASAGQQPRQNNVTQLPPTLSRVTGSAHEPNDTELSSVEALLGR